MINDYHDSPPSGWGTNARAQGRAVSSNSIVLLSTLLELANLSAILSSGVSPLLGKEQGSPGRFVHRSIADDCLESSLSERDSYMRIAKSRRPSRTGITESSGLSAYWRNPGLLWGLNWRVGGGMSGCPCLCHPDHPGFKGSRSPLSWER